MGLGTVWAAGPDVIARGDVYWVTVLGENFDNEPATKRTATEWFNLYPSDAIPVLADNDYITADYVGLRGWPTLLLLEPDLKVAVHDPESYVTVFYELAERFPQ